jgi:hypothetical protein
MSDPARLSRRDALAGGILSAIAVSGAGRVAAGAAVSTIPDGSLLYTLFPDLRHVSTLSRACLRSFPTTASAGQLYAWIVPAGRSDTENVVTIAELRRSIRQRVRRDFDVDDTVQIDGWVLSMTELRMYALAALITPPTIGPTESGACPEARAEPATSPSRLPSRPAATAEQSASAF